VSFQGPQPLKLSHRKIDSLLSLPQQDGGNASAFEVTELRLWKIALNKGIISENYNAPLAFLHEQKRKIKVDINKKKKGVGGGLGKPGLKKLSKLGAPSSKLNNNAPSKLSGPNKVDERDEP